MEPLKKDQIYTGTVEGYSSEGLGIVRLDGAVVFVARAVRGETGGSEDHQSDENRGGGGDREDPTPPRRSGQSRSAPISGGAAAVTSST